MEESNSSEKNSEIHQTEAIAIIKEKYPDVKVRIAGYNLLKNSIIKRRSYANYIEKLINIIDKDCEKITFIPLNGDEEELVNSEEKEIKCKQIESRILYALAKIQKKNIVVKNFDKNIQKALSNN